MSVVFMIRGVSLEKDFRVGSLDELLYKNGLKDRRENFAHRFLNVHKNVWIFSNKDNFHFSLQYYHKPWVGILHKNNEREIIHEMLGKSKITVTVLPASWFGTFKWKTMLKTKFCCGRSPSIMKNNKFLDQKLWPSFSQYLDKVQLFKIHPEEGRLSE